MIDTYKMNLIRNVSDCLFKNRELLIKLISYPDHRGVLDQLSQTGFNQRPFEQHHKEACRMMLQDVESAVREAEPTSVNAANEYMNTVKSMILGIF